MIVKYLSKSPNYIQWKQVLSTNSHLALAVGGERRKQLSKQCWACHTGTSPSWEAKPSTAAGRVTAAKSECDHLWFNPGFSWQLDPSSRGWRSGGGGHCHWDHVCLTWHSQPCRGSWSSLQQWAETHAQHVVPGKLCRNTGFSALAQDSKGQLPGSSPPLQKLLDCLWHQLPWG